MNVLSDETQLQDLFVGYTKPKNNVAITLVVKQRAESW